MTEEEASANRVAENIRTIILQKRMAAYYAISLEYAELMRQWFLDKQGGNKFWNNQTKDAMNLMMFTGFKAEAAIGIRVQHGVWYGKWLEKANDGKHSALLPIMKEWTWRYMRAIERIGRDNV